MKKKLIILGVIILSVIGIFTFWDELEYIFYDCKEQWVLRNKIIWKPDLDLAWNDFKYSPGKKLTDNISTNVGFSVRYHYLDTGIMYRTKTIFVPSKSFVSDTTDPLALRIANARFDLCEIYRRKLDSKIKRLKQRFIYSPSDSIISGVKDGSLIDDFLFDDFSINDSLLNQDKIYSNLFEEEWNDFLAVNKSQVEETLEKLENRIKIELKKTTHHLSQE